MLDMTTTFQEAKQADGKTTDNRSQAIRSINDKAERRRSRRRTTTASPYLVRFGPARQASSCRHVEKVGAQNSIKSPWVAVPTGCATAEGRRPSRINHWRAPSLDGLADLKTGSSDLVRDLPIATESVAEQTAGRFDRAVGQGPYQRPGRAIARRAPGDAHAADDDGLNRLAGIRQGRRPGSGQSARERVRRGEDHRFDLWKPSSRC